MNIIKTDIPEVLIFEPKVFNDARGYFFESFNSQVFNKAVGRKVEFVQDNHSLSHKGVLRGLHYQLDPHAQGKLIRCIEGEVFDVAVDIRRSLPTFGQWVGVKLSAQNKRQMWIPEGFAHGFMVLSETAQLMYKVTNYYEPKSERKIIWNDSQIGICWPTLIDGDVLLSEEDLQAKPLAESEIYL